MTSSSGRLAGKVALISGTGGGQGRVAAETFAREGASVVGCDINEETAAETAEIVRRAGLQMVSLGAVDLAEPAAARSWVERAVDEFGGVDILYNNASLPRFAPFAEMSIEDYRFTIRNELDVMWFSTQAAWPALVARGGGAIVNIASIAAVRGLRDLPQSAHAAAKGAVIGLTAQLAAEGAASNIRVNCISPGVIDSPPVQEMLGMGEASPLAPVIGNTAQRRPGPPSAIVDAALYLASDEASWTTGAHLLVDGGSSAII
jgi:meso-butanediol dehydrogenase/(S,S)-butanediol dehydrogenase/diacetyl reductase